MNSVGRVRFPRSIVTSAILLSLFVLILIPPAFLDFDKASRHLIACLIFLFLFSRDALGQRNLFSSSIKRVDLYIILFVLWSFCSSFWSADPDLAVWDSMLWLMSFLGFWVVATFNDTVVKNRFWLYWFFVLFVIHLISILSSYFLVKNSLDTNFLGFHKNYLVQYLLFLSIFLFRFPNTSREFFLDTLLFILCAYVALLCKAKGALIMSLLLYMFFVHKYVWQIILKTIEVEVSFLNRTSNRVILSVIISGLFLVFFSFIFWDKINMSNLRWVMFEKSIKAFWDSKLIGAGSGNWYNVAYNYGIEDYKKLYDIINPSFYGSHNKLLKILTELGLPGFLLFVLFLKESFTALYRMHSNTGKRIICLLVFYLVSTSLYESSYSYLFSLSGIQLICFASLGIMRNNSKTLIPLKWKATPVILCLITCVYFGLAFHIHREVSYDANLRDMGNEERIQVLSYADRVSDRYFIYDADIKLRLARMLRNSDPDRAYALFKSLNQKNTYNLFHLYESALFYQDYGYSDELQAVEKRARHVQKKFLPMEYVSIRSDYFLFDNKSMFKEKLSVFEETLENLNSRYEEEMAEAPAMRFYYEKRINRLEDLIEQIEKDKVYIFSIESE